MALPGAPVETRLPLRSWVPSSASHRPCDGKDAGSGSLILRELEIELSDGTRMPISGLDSLVKRIEDLILLALILPFALPIMLGAAMAIKLDSPGPVFFRQDREGFNNRRFAIWKFRSMQVDQLEYDAIHQASRHDPRITRIGRILRATSIDELPQLINVLRGEMSLIGPRPERPELEGQLETEIPNYRLRHWVRPGLSGWAQVNMPYTSSVEDSELKLSYDLYYLRNAGLWLDLLILAKTIKIVLKAAGR